MNDVFWFFMVFASFGIGCLLGGLESKRRLLNLLGKALDVSENNQYRYTWLGCIQYLMDHF